MTWRVEVHDRGLFLVAWYRVEGKAYAEAKQWRASGAWAKVTGWTGQESRPCVDDVVRT